MSDRFETTMTLPAARADGRDPNELVRGQPLWKIRQNVEKARRKAIDVRSDQAARKRERTLMFAAVNAGAAQLLPAEVYDLDALKRKLDAQAAAALLAEQRQREGLMRILQAVTTQRQQP